jgi:hypothetical protein
MALAPLEPWLAKRRRRPINMAQVVALYRVAVVFQPGLVFEKSSHRPMRYR